MNDIDLYLNKLRDDEMFQLIIKQKILPKRPIISTYDPVTDNTEKWKADSLMRQGFDLCLTAFGMQKEFYDE